MISAIHRKSVQDSAVTVCRVHENVLGKEGRLHCSTNGCWQSLTQSCTISLLAKLECDSKCLSSVPHAHMSLFATQRDFRQPVGYMLDCLHSDVGSLLLQAPQQNMLAHADP